MTEVIAVATTDLEFEQFGALIREYWGWLQTRYAGQAGLMDRME